jgi:hypothetical protein
LKSCPNDAGAPALYTHSAKGPDTRWIEPSGTWRGSRTYRSSYLNQLRARFSYVLIDCPSLKETTDVLGLTTLVDGVLLVIEANRTTKSQIAHLERTIEHGGGKILGHLLNKRTYPIPEWANINLQRWGF